MRTLLLSLLAFFAIWNLPAQVHDTLRTDSTSLMDDLLIQQQQKRLDSLVRTRIEKEMGQLVGDSKRKTELEEQLRNIRSNDSLRSERQKHQVELLRKTAKGHPVTLLKDTLFHIYLRLGSFNAAERAQAITNRIENLYDDEFFEADSLAIIPGESSYDIVYRDKMIMTVTELDALYFDQSVETVATRLQREIQISISRNKSENSLVNWLRRLALVALVVLGISIVIFIINRVFRVLRLKVIQNKDEYFKGIRVKSFRLFDPKGHLLFVLRVMTALRVIAIVLGLYLSLPLLFSIFPQTKDYTYMLLNWIISPAKSVIHSIVSYLPNLFTVLVIFLFTRYAVKGVRYLAMEVRSGNLHINGFFPDWALPTFNIVRFLLYAFMVVVVFPYLPGSDSPAFQGISVFLGILFSLGSTSAIANIVAGLVITYMRPFKVGDRVQIGDITGDVLEKTLLVTRIRTIKNEEITVPNAKVLSSHTTNYTSGAEHKGLIIHTTVTIGYDVHWRKVHETLIRAAKASISIEEQPEPFVLQTGLEDFYVSYQINAYTRNPASLADTYSSLHQNIQDFCAEDGIEILSPHYRAMRDGNESTIPAAARVKEKTEKSNES